MSEHDRTHHLDEVESGHHHGHHAGMASQESAPAEAAGSMPGMEHDHDMHEGHADGDSSSGMHDHHGGHQDHSGHEIMFRNRFWICLVLSIPVIAYSPAIQSWFGYTAPLFTGSQLILPVLATAVFIIGGLPFLRMARMELRMRAPGMMTLISLAISVAYVFSMATLLWTLGDDFFWEVATLIDIMLLGHWMEMRSVRQASGALDALSRLLPDTAEVVLAGGEIEERPAAGLRADELVLVRPGAAVPADGVVVEGESDVNEAMITGESKHVKKGLGAPVIAGTVNTGDGSLRVRVTAVGDETALSGIMRLVEEAQQSKSSTQLLADKAASWLFYAALIAALIAALVWSLVLGGVTAQVIATAVTVLVIACPHALGLAVPLVVANTTAIGANNGILVRDREAMETAKDLDVITFDKTGTLTKGQIGVVGSVAIEGRDISQALAVTAAAERDSEHPLARAIRRAADENKLEIPRSTEFEVLKGRGLRATVGGALVHVGGPQLLAGLDLQPPPALADFARQSGQDGRSVIYLVEDRQVTAAFALADVVREESGLAVRALHDMGLEVAMLTGDSHAVAQSVARELGIDHIFAEVLPADKDQKIVELQKQGKRVAMVGDGVNDAPALARADVGIAIGSGTDVAVQSAGLILVKSNPLDVVRILKLSAASYRKQTQNIWWGAGYNIVMIPLAAGILAPWGFIMPPAIGALLMSLSTIIVAINAQTLRRVNLAVE